MTKYPNSACEQHKDVKTSEPVCIICMANEMERYRNALLAIVKHHDTLAGPGMTAYSTVSNIARKALGMVL